MSLPIHHGPVATPDYAKAYSAGGPTGATCVLLASAIFKQFTGLGKGGAAKGVAMNR